MPEVHVINHRIFVVVGSCSPDSNTTREAIFDGDSKYLLVSSFDIRKSVFSSSLDVNCKYTDLAAIKLDFFFWMLFSNILIKKSTVTIDLKIFHLSICLYKLSCFCNRTKLMGFHTVTLKGTPFRIVLCRQVQRRVERNPNAIMIAIFITTD